MGKAAQPVEIPEGVKITLQYQYRKCGKSCCKQCHIGPGHGPYYYAFWRVAGTLNSRYFGPIYPDLAGVEDQIEPEEANVV